MIEYRVGNMFEQLPENKYIVIPHIVNDIGAWGAGFVLALNKYFPKAKEDYLSWVKGDGVFGLGSARGTQVKENVSVFHMCAQSGTKSVNNPKPIRYLALASCLQAVANFELSDYEIHAPAFGTDLAGGDWSVIRPLVEEAFVNVKHVYIYTLTQEQMDKIQT